MTKIEQRVYKYVVGHHLIDTSSTVLIALSGGADSVCLLLMMKRLGLDCHAVHCNFHLRGEESNRDEAFVSRLCQTRDVPLHITHFDTEAYAEEHGVSVEMAARDLRYAYFVRVAKEIGADAVCVGHHRDDNAETFLLNAVRGTGIMGLCGIKEMRYEGEVPVVRPLLDLTRSEILSYLKSKNQEYVTDSTNLVADVCRNKIRLEVMPVLKSLNPAAVENINNSIGNMKEVYKVYAAAIKADINRCLVEEGVMSVDMLLASVSPISVLHEWLQGKGFNRSQELDMIEAARVGQSGKIFESPVESLLVDRKSLVLKSSVIPVDPSRIEISTLPVAEVVIKRDAHYAYLDADKIHGELSVRSVKNSDSFLPFGMRGSKLLSDFLTDCKLNLFQKQQQLVVADERDIAWVVGLRASELYRVDRETKRVVVIHYS